MDTDDRAPEGRCGYVLEPGDVPVDTADELEPGSDQWYETSDAVCCWRPSWDGAEDGRCIWHGMTDEKPAETLIEARAEGPERLDGAYVPAVELGEAIDFEGCRLQGATFHGTDLLGTSFVEVRARAAQFPDADLAVTQFQNANLRVAKFREAHLGDAGFLDADLRGADFSDAYLGEVRFPNADLRGAQFPNAQLGEAQFQNADLRAAEFPEAYLGEAQFPNANLEHVEFPSADLTGARFPDANLRYATFPDAVLRGTSFEGAYMTLGDVEGDDAEINGATVFGWSHWERTENWDRAVLAYRSIQQTLRGRALPGEIERYRIREMHMRRKAAFSGNPIQWMKLAIARWTTLYAESPWRVAYTSLAVIGVWTLLYPNAGGFEASAGATTPVANLSRVLAVPGWLSSTVEPWLTSFYFSVVTFTTVGYGDLQPATNMGRLLASVETFLGALLMALLVFVLGRRATR